LPSPINFFLFPHLLDGVQLPELRGHKGVHLLAERVRLLHDKEAVQVYKYPGVCV
jgi:hypothetical protein